MAGLTRSVINELKDDYEKRVVGRAVFIYTASFLGPVSRIKNVLKRGGANVTDIEARLLRLSDTFLSKYEDIRHRIGAHRQYLRLDVLLEKWNSIDSASVPTLADDLRYIYEEIAKKDSTIREYEDISVNPTIKNELNRRSVETGVRVGTDSLSHTRAETAGLIPTHRDQVVGQRVVSIIDMLDREERLLRTVGDWVPMRRLILSLIVNDAISLNDNLFPRVGGNPRYVETSFLECMQEGNYGGTGILQYAQGIKDNGLETKLRNIRNTITAHVDKGKPLDYLLAGLDSTKIGEIQKFVYPLIRGFWGCCSRDGRTMIYLIHNETMKGVHSVVQTGLVKKYGDNA